MKKNGIIALATGAAVLTGGGIAASMNQNDTPQTQAQAIAKAAPSRASRHMQRSVAPSVAATLKYRGADASPLRVKQGQTVKEALLASKVNLNNHDIVTPDLSTVVKQGTVITVTNKYVKRWTEDRKMEQPADVVVRDASMPQGVTKQVRDGHPGLAKVTIASTIVNGKAVSTDVVDRDVVNDAVADKVLMGTYVAPQRSEEPKPKVASQETKRAVKRAQERPESVEKPQARVTKRAKTKRAEVREERRAQARKVNKSTRNVAPQSRAAGDTSKAGMWDKIARCESSGNWKTNTGNGYYGGLQFDIPTWRSAGGSQYASRPDLATREQQIAVANRLHSKRGLQPWACAHAAR